MHRKKRDPRTIGIFVGLLLVLAPAISWADDTSVRSVPAATPSPSSVVSIGRPHTCGGYYPLEAIQNMVQGATTVAFTIEADGTTHDISVAITSGNSDLDKAAIACVSHWLYKPAEKNGEPVAAPWKARIVWIYPTIPLPVGYSSVAHQCFSAASLAVVHADPAIDLAVAYWIDADGSISAPRVAQPSPDPAFDAAILKCIASWAYTPAQRDGAPIRIVWGARVIFRPNEGFGIGEGPLSPHACDPRLYPPKALASRTEGTTVLSFRITERGLLDNILVAESSGNAELDEASKACVATWIYRPDVIGGLVTPRLWSAQVAWKDGRAIAAELGNGDGQP